MLAPSITQWAGPHTLQRGDVAINNSGATILVHSSKTIRNPSRAAILNIPALPNSRYCAVAAWKASCALYPAPDTAPAFTIAWGRALSVPVTTAVLRHYHGATGHPDPGSVTLQSEEKYCDSSNTAGLYTGGNHEAGYLDQCCCVRVHIPKTHASALPSKLGMLGRCL